MRWTFNCCKVNGGNGNRMDIEDTTDAVIPN
jgi:hypothetical protein